MPTNFSVSGPYKVPTYRGNGGRTITDENVRQFWDKHEVFGASRGCYVFGIRAGRGLTPGYVGKATKSFRQETFAHHKLTRYQQFLIEYKRGTPVIFFVVAPKKKGVPNGKRIVQLESFLLFRLFHVAANHDLLNIRGTKAERWSIVGVIRSSQGKPSASAQLFKQIMKISK